MIKIALTGDINDFIINVTNFPEYRTFDPRKIIRRDAQIWMEDFGDDLFLNAEVVDADENIIKIDFCTVQFSNSLNSNLAVNIGTSEFEKGKLTGYTLEKKSFTSFDTPEIWERLYALYTHIMVCLYFDSKYNELMDTKQNEILAINSKVDLMTVELIKNR